MAATASPTYAQLHQQLTKGKPSAVYMLHGEEGFYIDRLTADIETLVPDEERDFNLFVLYGPETTPEEVMECCRRFPMMSDRVVVILKEAQAMRADVLNRLHTYIADINPQCVLAICCRGAAAKGRDLLAALRRSDQCVVFESKRLKENSVGPVIEQMVKEGGLSIQPKALIMLRDYVGTDLDRLYNEVNKLVMILGQGAAITPEAVELHIGISKDYNAFEYIDALAVRDAAKAFRIVAYFRSNPKNNPVQALMPNVFNFFANLMAMQMSADRSPGAMAAAAGLKSTWQMRQYEPALRNYNAWQTMEIISAIRRLDCASKGVNSRQDPYALLHDLTFHILNAPGRVTI